MRLFLSEVEERPNFQGFFRKLPLGTSVFADFKAAVIANTALSIEIMRTELQESKDPSSEPFIVSHYERDPGFMKSLIRAFLAKSSFEEVPHPSFLCFALFPLFSSYSPRKSCSTTSWTF